MEKKGSRESGVEQTLGKGKQKKKMKKEDYPKGHFTEKKSDLGIISRMYRYVFGHRGSAEARCLPEQA